MNDTHPHWLFVYGTLKRGHGNNSLLQKHNSKYVAVAVTLDKFLLNGGFPYVFPAPEDKHAQPFLGRIIGHLYRVTDAGLAACDWLEGHPVSYCRTPIKVEYPRDSPQHVTEAGIYLMPRKVWGPLSTCQRPDKDGLLEWGREDRITARNFQRETGKRFRDRA